MSKYEPLNTWEKDKKHYTTKEEIIIAELETLKIKMNTYCEYHAIYDWGLIDLIDERIEQIKGESNVL